MDVDVAADALEKAILEKAKKDGYQTVVRNILKSFLNEPSKESSENVAWTLGVLSRGGYIGELDVWQICKHIGILNIET